MPDRTMTISMDQNALAAVIQDLAALAATKVPIGTVITTSHILAAIPEYVNLDSSRDHIARMMTPLRK